MPCDQVVEITCELGASTDTELLHAAVKRLKLDPRRTATGFSFKGGSYAKGGKLTIDTLRSVTPYAAQIAAIKRGYANETVRAAARKNGWTVETDRTDENVLHVRRLS